MLGKLISAIHDNSMWYSGKCTLEIVDGEKAQLFVIVVGSSWSSKITQK